MRVTVVRPGRVSGLVGVLLVVLLASPVAGAPSGAFAATDPGASAPQVAADASTMNITTVSADGPVVVQPSPDTVILWPDSQYNLTVAVNTTDYEGSNYVNLCVADLNASDGAAADNASCVAFLPESNGGRTIRVPHPTGSAGTQRLSLSVRNQQTNETLARRNVTVTVVRPADDFDSDLLSNEREIELGTDLATADTDKDGLDDGAEVDNYGTDPLSTDTDGDGLLDGEEVNSATNATLTDTDGDGLPDGEEVNELETSATNPDTDGDGLSDGDEVRRYESSPTNPDTDGDGLSDGMEVEIYGTSPVSVHTDGDRLSDGTEVRLGTDPTNPWTGVWILGLVLGALAIGGLLIGRTYGDRLREAYGAWRRTLARTTPDGDDGGSEAAASAGSGGATVDHPPPDWNGSAAPVVKTDEDRIMELLYGHEGRLHQHELVERTDWSASKVSRLLSSMAEEGMIEKIRLGRKNVVTVAPGSEEGGEGGTADGDDERVENVDDGGVEDENDESDGREVDDGVEGDGPEDGDDDSNGPDDGGREGTYA